MFKNKNMKKFLLKFVWNLIFTLVTSGQLILCQNFVDERAEAENSIKSHLTADGWLMATQSGRETNLTAGQERLLQGVGIASSQRYQNSLKVLNILQKALMFMRLDSNAPTVVVFGSIESIDFEKIFAASQVPFLIVNNSVKWHIRKHFNSNFLSIIFLAPNYSLEHPLFTALQQVLKRFHLKKIIVIKESPSTEQDKQLLNWFHSKDFWQVWLMDFEDNTMALQHLTGKLLWHVTLEEFMASVSHWRNLQGQAINCSMAVNPPRAFIEYDAQNNITLKGYFGTIISLFAQYYNASLKTFVSAVYTEMDCVNYISRGQLDICIDALPYDEQYLVTYPDELVNSYLMVPYDKPLARFYYFLKPFQQNVWVVVTVSFFYKIITLSFIHRLQHGSWNSSLQILYAVVSVLYLPFRLTRVKQPYRGFLEIIMICVGFVVANWYLSVLSSLLFTRLYSQDINSFENLRDHNISIMVDEFEFYLLESSHIDAIVRQQLKLVPNDILLQHRGNLDPQYAYYSQYDKIDFYLHQQKFLQRPRMKVITPPVNIIMGGIPMRPNWPFQDLLNDFYKRLLESGTYQRFYVEALEEGIYLGYLHYFPNEYQHVEPLSIEYFQLPAMLLSVGFLLAFMAFLLELFVFKVCCPKRF